MNEQQFKRRIERLQQIEQRRETNEKAAIINEQQLKRRIERLQQIEQRRALIEARQKERLLALELNQEALILRRQRIALLRRWLRNMR